MAKQRNAKIKPYRFLAGFVALASAAASWPVMAQQTVVIGNPSNAPAVEVDLSVLNSAIPVPAKRRTSSLPDLMPPDTANMPPARATSSVRLAPPESPAPIAQPAAALPAPAPQNPVPAATAAPTRPADPVTLKPAAEPKPIVPHAAQPAAPPAPSQTAAALPAAPPAAAVNAALTFMPDATDLSVEAAAQLDALISLLNPEDRVQLKSHASSSGNDAETRRIALKRALAARSHFLANGIDSTRIDVRALGPAADGGPDDRIDVIVVSK